MLRNINLVCKKNVLSIAKLLKNSEVLLKKNKPQVNFFHTLLYTDDPTFILCIEVLGNGHFLFFFATIKMQSLPTLEGDVIKVREFAKFSQFLSIYRYTQKLHVFYVFIIFVNYIP